MQKEDVGIIGRVTVPYRKAFFALQRQAAPYGVKAKDIRPGEYHSEPLPMHEGPVSYTHLDVYKRQELPAITIPGTVKRIDIYAFWACNKLTKLTIEEGVEVIGDSAFGVCMHLPEVKLPSTVTTIEDSAFWKCEELNKVTLPKSITSIGSEVFPVSDDHKMTVYGEKDSFAHNFVKDNKNFTFVETNG